MRPRGFVGMLSLALALQGCAMSFSPPKRAAQVQPPVVQTLPLTVGVHYPEAFRTSHEVRAVYERLWYGAVQESVPTKPRDGWAWEYPYGEQSVVLLNAALQGLFEKVVPIDAWPRAEFHIQDPVVAVVVPRLVEVGVRHLTSTGGRLLQADTNPYRVTVAYRIELYAPDGRLVQTWNVKSQERNTRSFTTAWLEMGDLIHAGMTDAATQFIQRILEERKELRERLAPENISGDASR